MSFTNNLQKLNDHNCHFLLLLQKLSQLQYSLTFPAKRCEIIPLLATRASAIVVFPAKDIYRLQLEANFKKTKLIH